MNDLFNTDLKTPDFRLIVNDDDISAAISNRLLSLTLTDTRGFDADTLQIELQDSKSDLALPPLTAKISLSLGWKNQPLTDKGIFTVSELEYSGTPNKLILTATSADLRASKKNSITAPKSRSFHDTTLGDIIETIAKEHLLSVVISKGLSGIRINHIDQTGESDIGLLTRMGEKYNAIASIKHGRLLFITFGKGVSASGKELPPVKINMSDCSNFHYRKQTRDAYTGVSAYWNNVKGAKRQKVTVGTSENLKELKPTFTTESEALEAARSELERSERATESLSISLIDGRAEIEAEAPLALGGFKPEIQGVRWAIAAVTHTMGDNGFITQINAEPINSEKN